GEPLQVDEPEGSFDPTRRHRRARVTQRTFKVARSRGALLLARELAASVTVPTATSTPDELRDLATHSHRRPTRGRMPKLAATSSVRTACSSSPTGPRRSRRARGVSPSRRMQGPHRGSWGAVGPLHDGPT